MTRLRAVVTAVVASVFCLSLLVCHRTVRTHAAPPAQQEAAVQAPPPALPAPAPAPVPVPRTAAPVVPAPEYATTAPAPQTVMSAAKPTPPQPKHHRLKATAPGDVASAESEQAPVAPKSMKVLAPSSANRSPASVGGAGQAVPEDDDAALDNALANLRQGNLAYITPDKMKTGATAHIVARIGSDKVSVQTLESGMAPDAGEKVTTVATSVTAKMKMSLKSADFGITALSSEEQLVAGTTPTTWEWDITPKHSGKLRLHLAAVVELNSIAKDFTAIDREIAVQVDPIEEASTFVAGNWQWLIATLTTIVGGGWKLLSDRRKKQQAAAKGI